MIIPIAGDFTIVQMTRLTPTAIDYRVFASRTSGQKAIQTLRDDIIVL